MDTLQITAQEAIRNAYKALQDGDKQAARRWAEQAASLGPELEEPWLVLAAVAAPRASVAYLEKALRINPHSLTARKGMDWAQSRLRQQGAPRSPTPSLPTPRPQRPRRIAFYASLAVLACLAIAVSFWTGAIPVRAFLVQPTQANWGGSEILKPTYTPTPSPTPSPTLTPSPTATPLPSLTPLPPIQASPIPQEAAYPGNKSILVDISEQRLYAYEGDVLVFSFIASTGIGNSTRVGSFSVLDKIPTAYASTWDLWMPSWLGIYWSHNLENGIHALPILSNGVTLWAGYLGAPVSYGCIVLDTNAAQSLYDWAEVGMPVDIRW